MIFAWRVRNHLVSDGPPVVFPNGGDLKMITISNGKAFGNARDGFHIEGGNVELLDCEARGNGRHGFYIGQENTVLTHLAELGRALNQETRLDAEAKARALHSIEALQREAQLEPNARRSATVTVALQNLANLIVILTAFNQHYGALQKAFLVIKAYFGM
jgi:hypothetical protein